MSAGKCPGTQSISEESSSVGEEAGVLMISRPLLWNRAAGCNRVQADPAPQFTNKLKAQVPPLKFHVTHIYKKTGFKGIGHSWPFLFRYWHIGGSSISSRTQAHQIYLYVGFTLEKTKWNCILAISVTVPPLLVKYGMWHILDNKQIYIKYIYKCMLML